MSELERKFHETWLGMVQPSEGLVVSVPVLVDGQVMDRTHSIERQQILLDRCPLNESTNRRRIADLAPFLADLLNLTPKRVDAGEALPPKLSLYVPEGPQTIRPTLAIHRPGKLEAPDIESPDDNPAIVAGRRYQILVWDLAAPPEQGGAGPDGIGLNLDKPESRTGNWDYPPAAKFDRLLRHARVPIGLLTNREVVRLVYAPHGESSGTITFRIPDMAETAGRPILDAFVGLLHQRRLFVLGDDRRLPALLAESRQRQANVTNELADQVFEALEALLLGFEAAAERDGHEQLDAALERADDHLYGGLLTVLLRLVFLLYAEDRGLMPVEHELYEQNMSVLGLFERLQADAGAYPDSMHRRFGAWDLLIATWRAVYLGVDHGELHMPPRHGQLFDPHLFPFIEGWGPAGSAPIIQADARADVRTPSIDDGTVLTVLEKLLIFQRQRLSYRALDVEQIGGVYEALMGYHVVRLDSAAVCLRPQRARKVWLSAAEVLAVTPSRRAAWLKDDIGLAKQTATKLAAALADKKPKTDADVLTVLDEHAVKRTQRAEKHRLVIQPGHERRRTSSHYTPNSLTAPIVSRTLEPLITAMGENPGSELLLSLKICDPAMGSGAFLVEVCRQLGEHVVAAWTREGKLAKIAEDFDDPVMHARRMVAQRCVYGVDKNPFAVNLAKLSLWLVTLAKNLPFTFVDHALRHGDSLVGLSFDQIRVFHWKPDAKQQELFADEVRGALDEAVGLRQDICDLADDETSGGMREKERLLRDAEDALSRIRLIGDVIVGAFFAEDKDKARETERVRRLGIVREWLRSGEGPTAELLAMQVAMRERTPVFHWMVEFPEVFYAERPDPLERGEVNRAAFMDAFVGNPPFMGGQRVSAMMGDLYRDWLAESFRASSHSDLCAYFFRLTFTLLGQHGCVGLIATNSIAQGETRRTSLLHIRQNHGDIYHAQREVAWAGDAAVITAVVHFGIGRALPKFRTLDGKHVLKITAFLESSGPDDDPTSLASNAGLSVLGSTILGIGFVFEDGNPDATPISVMNDLLKAAPMNQERVFGFLGGDELNRSPQQVPSRYIIDFGDMPLSEAQSWPDLLDIVERKVRPARAGIKRKDRGERWWQYATRAPALRAYLKSHDRFLAVAGVSTHLAPSFVGSDVLVPHSVVTFLFDSYGACSILQSRIHAFWARRFSSTMKSDARYIPTDCFENFPFPTSDPRTQIPALEDIGQRLYDTRAAYMLATDQGLTKTYNKLKDLDCNDPEILTLRRLHEELDRKVLDAYGWTDIEVPPYGTPTTDAERKALEAFEDEIIDRLFVLNAERAAEEARLGLTTRGKKTKKASAKKKAPDDGGQQSLL
jgi:hypothetical protein